MGRFTIVAVIPGGVEEKESLTLRRCRLADDVADGEPPVHWDEPLDEALARSKALADYLAALT